MGASQSNVDVEPMNKYGWHRDFHDGRDFTYNGVPHPDLPTEIDLTSEQLPVYDQSQLGSCTANALCYGYAYDEKKESTFSPSRLFLYYCERDEEGTVKIDAGASLRDGCKVMHKIGICQEEFWPYDIDKFAERPPDQCFKNANHHKTLEYRRVEQDCDSILASLQEGYPVIFGFNVYESFESFEVELTGIVPLPDVEEKLLGGHAVAIVGICKQKKMFLVRNSWGKSWGIKSPAKHMGHCWMPFDYILNPDLASDFWQIKSVADDF